MDIKAIVARIEERIAALQADDPSVSTRSVSILAGRSPDAIRNLQRAARSKKPGGAHAATISAIADALAVPVDWLLYGTGPVPVEHAEAISRLTQAYRAATPGLRDHLLREAETVLLAAEALRRREEDEQDRQGRAGE